MVCTCAILGSRQRGWVCGGHGARCPSGPYSCGSQMCSADPSEWRGACGSCHVLSGSGRRLLFLPPPLAAPSCLPSGRPLRPRAHTGFLLERTLAKGGQGTPGLGALHTCTFWGEPSVPLGFPTEERCTGKQDRTASVQQDWACPVARSRGGRNEMWLGSQEIQGPPPTSGAEHRALVTSQPLILLQTLKGSCPPLQSSPESLFKRPGAPASSWLHP